MATNIHFEFGIPMAAKKGADGDDGKSAYELAVEAGFHGTLEHWLASLKGADAEPLDLTATAHLTMLDSEEEPSIKVTVT